MRGVGGAIFAPSAPWSVPIPGVLALLDVALQGVMVVDANASFAATNAVLLRIVPLAAPTITSVLPASPLPGQTTFVQGTNFLAGMQGTVAGAPVALNLTSPTQASFVSPLVLPCDAPLVFTNLGGSTAQRVLNPTPTVTNAPNTSGTSLGGQTYILIGQGLLGCTVTFQGAPMTISTQTATVIVGTTPPGSPGPATVVVRNPNGCQATVNYTYL